MVSMPMLRMTAAVLAVGFVALAAATPAGAGLEGREIEFRVRSKDSDTACVSYYETKGKRGPAKHFDRVTQDIVDLPFSTTVGATAKARHWAIAAWATDDCASTDDPVGTVRCAIVVDGKRQARSSANDAIAFCFS